MRLTNIHFRLLALGILGAGTYGLLAPASAQAPAQPFQGPPQPTSRVAPAPTHAAANNLPAPTLMQSVFEAPGRTAVMEEYRVGATQTGAVADAGEAGPPAPPTRIEFLAAVACERGREDQRHKGLKIVIERPRPDGRLEQIVCYVDRGEMQPLATALAQLGDAARRERDGRDVWRDGGRDRDARRRGDRPTARTAGYAAADFAVTVRVESGRPTLEVRNPNRPDSRVTIASEGVQATLDEWAGWIQSAHLLLERK